MKRVALVTGGARGIGLGVAGALAREGFDLALCGTRNAEDVARALDALRASGATTNTCAGLSNAGTVSERAWAGTSASERKWPSPTCCRRQFSSSVTTWMVAAVSKSAGGSLKARWPFSPMPMTQASAGYSSSKAV